MVGKTSIIKAANKKLESTGIKAIYVNLWGAKGMVDSMKSTFQ
jgi:hypothetical protein